MIFFSVHIKAEGMTQFDFFHAVMICARYVAGGPRLRDDGVITGPRRYLIIIQFGFIHVAVVV